MPVVFFKNCQESVGRDYLILWGAEVRRGATVVCMEHTLQMQKLFLPMCVIHIYACFGC